MHEQRVSRRGFLGAASATSVAATIVPRHVLGAPGGLPPSEMITYGVIGNGRRRDSGIRGPFKKIAFCDVDAAQLTGVPENARYRDFRRLLDRKDIDAVCISTPPHWHALICIAAAPKRNPHAFPLLTEILKDMGDPGVKAMRSAMTRALPATRNPDLFVWLVGELARTGKEGVNAAVSAVVQALKGTDVCLFEAAARQVKALGPDCVKQAMPLLEKASRGTDARMAKVAADALAALGQVAPK
jgi:hypothetical protein